jgi:hypothetical protein
MIDSKRFLQHFYWDTIFQFYGLGLRSSAKSLDDVSKLGDPDKFYPKKNGYCRLFGKKLNQLLRENKADKSR